VLSIKTILPSTNHIERYRGTEAILHSPAMRKEYGLFLKILWLGGYVDCICEACKDDMEEKLDV
jgi:hypothetical protein